MKMMTTKLENLSQDQLLYDEWLLTNGIGGFACGSISGALMRKYHSLLNAALPNPYGRTIMLNYVADSILEDSKEEVFLSSIRTKETSAISPSHVVEFRIENGLPIWIYNINGVLIEKSLLLIYQQNTLHMSYKIISQHDQIQLKWRPFFHFRLNEQPVNVEIPNESYTINARDSQYEIECPNFPALRIYNSLQAPFTVSSQTSNDVFYEIEAARGYESYGSLISPGFFQFSLSPKERVTFVVSTEPWKTIFAIVPKEAWFIEKTRKRNLLKIAGLAGKFPNTAKLILAADQFIITPITRFEDMIRLQAIGEQTKTIIAGFPWFTDWGRDTMISLEGLTLTTGRSREAYSILHTFAHYIKNGLIPNMFPDGENKGIYNTADATLWFFHAIDRYIEITNDEEILEFLLPKLNEIIQHHMQGTLYGIKMDKDCLLMQGQMGLQLTWMDAKVGDWVVTPRRGKAVEINALWYNALKLFEKWTGKLSDIVQKCQESFNQKFWYEKEQYLYDIVEGEDGNDIALRPNQLFAISLKFPVLYQERWKSVIDIVKKELLTPVGLRTLSPLHPDYKSNYDGDLRARDAAYHQGTVWPWLIGSYIDVWLKVYPENVEHAYEVLKGLEEHLNNSCMGTVSEIFDACPPYKARGCFAQAWSVAELLRCLVKVASLLKEKE